MKKLLIPIITLLSFTTTAQQLSIGDTLPDVQIDSVLNYSSSSFALSRFSEGKPTILFFFGSACSVSKRYMRVADSIQKAHPGDLKVLLVTIEKTSAIKKLLEQTPMFSGIHLPVATANTVLREYFPFLTVPHIIWLNKDNKVEAISAGRDFTRENVKTLIEGKPLVLEQKKDPSSMGQFLAADPIMLYDYPVHRDKMRFYSYFSDYRHDLASSGKKNERYNGFTRLAATNYSLVSLYKHAYPEMYRSHETQVFFGDSGLHKPDPIAKKGYYCYDLLVKGTLDSAHRIMRRDLRNFFGYASRIEKKLIPCYVLRRTSNVDKLASKATKPGSFETEDGILMLGSDLDGITSLSMPRFPFRIVDETGYKGKVDILLPKDQSNIALVQQYLARNNLELVKAERVFDVLIIE